jgi:hypothetical protein
MHCRNVAREDMRTDRARLDNTPAWQTHSALSGVYVQCDSPLNHNGLDSSYMDTFDPSRQVYRSWFAGNELRFLEWAGYRVDFSAHVHLNMPVDPMHPILLELKE